MSMERIVDKIMPFLMSNNILQNNQCGFVPGTSSVTNMLCGLSSWTCNIDNGTPVGIIYLEKAFDQVPYNTLFKVLEHCSVRGKLLLWIESLMNERKFSFQ